MSPRPCGPTRPRGIDRSRSARQGSAPGGAPRARAARRPPLACARDAVALQAFLQSGGGDVLPGVPARDQPPIDSCRLKLLVAQLLRDRGERFWERDLPAPEPKRDPAFRSGSDVGGAERHDPGGRFAVEQQHAPGEPVAWIDLAIAQEPAQDREPLLVVDRRGRALPIAGLGDYYQAAFGSRARPASSTGSCCTASLTRAPPASGAVAGASARSARRPNVSPIVLQRISWLSTE